MTRILALSILAAVAVQAQQPPERVALETFAESIDAYVHLHWQVEARLPKLRVSPDAEGIRNAIDAMHAAMWAARPRAKAGDIFTSAVAAVFRARIADALAEGACDADAMVEDQAWDGEGALTAPVVNGPFPWRAASMTSPAVLSVLPVLPPELEYRFVGRDMALVDLHANLVVDVLPGALGAR